MLINIFIFIIFCFNKEQEGYYTEEIKTKKYLGIKENFWLGSLEIIYIKW